MPLPRRFLSTLAEEPEINLIPVMNLFVSLIPGLLMTAAFFSISVINASVPTQSNEITLDPTQRKITLSVQMDERGFSLSAMSEDASITPKELKALQLTVQKTKEGFDYEKFTDLLGKIKAHYQKSDTMILIPERDILYEDIVRAMDASREIKVSGSKSRSLLFPNVVVSSTVE